ncbi:hemerythrin domain-containing protein [Planotetraspora mira]|uniref:Hemerythrin n=1 Tax=Planotetraspora mira TaxID=58121 RepID=A0A8J3XAU6_9ACTN|nr:hemerythrin domain-containing protein [Planotetraspora mira]GII34372.1 hemerythrin [Planotetraspora mira]
MGDSRAAAKTAAENDVVDLLLRQHAAIRDLFDEVRNAPADQREEPFRRLVRLLAVHETAEEEMVHPYVSRRIEGAGAMVDDRLAEENEAKHMLTQLDRMGPANPKFMQNLDILRVAVLEHARAEERYEFPQLRAMTTDAERHVMAVAVRMAESMAPTHPHAGLESAVDNLLMGPPLAIMDRVRDAIRKVTKKDT